MPMIDMLGLHRPSKRSIIEYTNRANGSALTVEEIDFSLPQPVAGTWREEVTDRNTIVRLTANELSEYRDSVIVTYDRMDLAGLNSLLTFKVNAYLPETVGDLLAQVRRRYGIFIDPEDVNATDTLVDINQTGEGLPIYRITALETALGWIGNCTIEVGEGDAVMGDYLTQDQLPGLNYPVDGDGANGSALMYFYGLNFTDHVDALLMYSDGTFLDETNTELLGIIQAVDTGAGKDLWNLDPLATEWSLHGAEIVYNGINDQALPTNNDYKYVMGVLLRGDVTTPPGVFYLHYNDPFDPNEV